MLIVYGVERSAIIDSRLPTPDIMENSQTLDLITAGIAIAILIGGYFMMFTDVFTRKKK